MILQFTPLQRRILAIGVAVAIILSVFALLGAQKASSVQTPDTASADAGFSRDMQVHHSQAVEMSMIAWDRSTDPEVKAIAYDMATAQQAQIGHMYTWLENWNLPHSSRLEPMAWMDTTGGMDHASMGGGMPGMATDDDLEKPAHPNRGRHGPVVSEPDDRTPPRRHCHVQGRGGAGVHGHGAEFRPETGHRPTAGCRIYGSDAP